MPSKPPLLRRPKTEPRADEAHFLRVGLALGLILMLALPNLFAAIDSDDHPEAMTAAPAAPPIWQATEN